MSDIADTWSKEQILYATNEGDYDPANNPCGWDADGLPLNLKRFSKAVADTGREVRNAVAVATAAAAQGQAWVRLQDEDDAPIPPVKLADDQLSVPGDWSWLLVVGRAVRPSEESADSGWIKAVEYEPGNIRTVVTVDGWIVSAGISELWFGQDPKNAPSQPASLDPLEYEYLSCMDD